VLCVASPFEAAVGSGLRHRIVVVRVIFRAVVIKGGSYPMFQPGRWSECSGISPMVFL
jgi:hypothetical protein